jgi:hypothetical protein
MTQRQADQRLDFEALRHAIEHRDLDVMVGFYAEDAQLSIVDAGASQAHPFELRGNAEIAKHLRAVFSQKASHRIEREVASEDRVTFREACEYPDGSRILVETTLELGSGKIVRQVDLVTRVERADNEREIGPKAPTPLTRKQAHCGVDASSPDRLLRSKQATEKEDHR